MKGLWPFTGRAKEFDEVRRCLRTPDRAGVVVAGAAGVGKTRLAREVLAAEASAGSITAWVAATRAAASVPLAAFAHLLPAGEMLGRERIDVFRQVASELRVRGGEQGLVLAVDDANLLDDAAAALVLHLAASNAVQLLVTVRSGEPAPDAVVALWKDDLIERVELQPLNRMEVAELLSAALGAQVDSVAADRSWRVTTGNVLFLRELVDDLVTRGGLRDEGGIWCWRGDYRPGSRLSELVDARLGRVRGRGRLAAELLAVAEPLGSAVLAELAGGAAVGCLEREGLVAIEPDGRRLEARLVHPLYGEVLRASMTRTRRSQLCALLIDAMRARTRRLDDSMRLAAWSMEAGTSVDPAVLTNASQRANARFEYLLAERLARAALASGGGFAASLALGEALVAQDRHQEAKAVLAAVSGPSPNDAAMARLAYWRAFAIANVDGFDAALAVLLDAECQVSEARWQGFLRAQRANVLQLAGRSDEATALATELLETPGADDVAKLRALDPVVLPLALSGQTSKAAAAAEALIEPALRLRDVVPRAPAWVFTVWIVSLVLAGRLAEADAVVDRMDALRAEGVTVEVSPRFVTSWRGRIALCRGRPATAARYLREVVAELREQPGASRWQCWALALLAEAHAVSGCIVAAAEAGRECEAERKAIAPAPLSLLGGDVARALAWVPAARGELSAARRVAVDAATGSRAAGEYAVEVFALHEAVRLGVRGEVVTRLAELTQVVDGKWAPAASEHASGLVADDGVALERAAGAFEAIGALRLAAEAAAEAASAHRRRGLDARASASAARAAVLQAVCEGTRVPGLQLEDSGLACLSLREQEIAGLAAAGLSNTEIADRLVVSRRTVEGHLYRLYAKVGVSDRDALARLLAPPG